MDGGFLQAKRASASLSLASRIALGLLANHICVARNTNMVEHSIPANRKATPYGVAFLLAEHFVCNLNRSEYHFTGQSSTINKSQSSLKLYGYAFDPL